MDTTVEQVLAEYEQRIQGEEAAMRAAEKAGSAGGISPNDLLLPIGRDVGLLLNHLIKTNKCISVLEVGTSYGYGAIWLGEAARATGGKLTTLELAPNKIEHARAMATRAGLANSIEFIAGDAIASIHALSGPFDFVLLDIWKDLYIPAFDAFYGKLADGALVAADNMIFPAFARGDANAYRRHVRSKPDMGSVLLKTGQGVELSQKHAPL